MTAIVEMIEDAQLLAGYATTHKIALPGTMLQELLDAKANSAALMAPGPAQSAFFATYNAAVTATGQLAGAVRAGIARRARIRPLVANAQVLLAFAAANGKKVEDAVRNPIVAINSAVDDESLTVSQEQEFLKAYEGLTVALAPITTETLGASATVLPSLSGNDWRHIKRWSLGRFVNVSIFIAVLVGTCISLSYYAQGASALKRFNELRDTIARNDQDVPAKLALLESRRDAASAIEKKPPIDQPALDAARKAIAEADTALASAKASQKDAKEEFDAIPERLQHWSALPCDAGSSWLFSLVLCSKVDQPQNLPVATQATQATQATPTAVTNPLVKVEAARTVASRLNDVYLPLLLGWLGAHAFILRNMSKAIAERSFAPGSAFNHIVRTGLGALAGLASNWLLTPQAVGGAQWANLPVWALAFVAGYGIELVFAFMDRIINAFTSK
ncbi:MAG TPA: hypothetical protein VGM81_01240 [Burkholderiaceae bacterium]|jgi:hypothetical protein